MEQSEDENDDADGETYDTQHLAQAVQLFLERGGFVGRIVEHAGDISHLGLHAGFRDDAASASVGDDRAHVAAVDAVAQACVFGKDSGCVLFYGNGFSRERGLVDFQVDGFNQPQVGGNIVACFQNGDISRNYIGGRHLHDLSAAENLRVRACHFLQRLQRVARLVFLVNAQEGVQDNDGKDDDALQRLSQKNGNHGGDHQDDYQEILELLQNHLDQGFFLPSLQTVVSVFFNTFFGLFLCQTAGYVHLKLFGRI